MNTSVPPAIADYMRDLQRRSAQARWAKKTPEQKRDEMRRLSAMRKCVRSKSGG